MLSDFYHVLMIHPDPLMGFSAAQWLRARGIRVTLVSTPFEALFHLHKRPIDLVVATLSDTDTGWFAFTHQLARLGRTPPMVVATNLMLPTWMNHDIQPHLLERAAPPTDFVQLAELVDRMLEHRLVA